MQIGLDIISQSGYSIARLWWANPARCPWQPIWWPFNYRLKWSFHQGNIFTSICLSTGGYPSMPCRSVPGGSPIFLGDLQFCGGVSNFLGGLQFWGRGCLQFFWGSPIFFDGVSNFSGGIRSTFGRYASYWNAFLLIKTMINLLHFHVIF